MTTCLTEIIVCLSLLYVSASASPADSSPAPGEKKPTLEVLEISPACPAVLKAGEKVYVKVGYDMADCPAVQIWALPSKSTGREGSKSSGCAPIPHSGGQTGTATGWFYYDGAKEVSQIRVNMKDYNSGEYVCEVFHDVDLKWLPRPPRDYSKRKLEGIKTLVGSWTWNIDFDGEEHYSSTERDFWWKAEEENVRRMDLYNSTGFCVISEKDFESIDLEYLKNRRYEPGPIPATGDISCLKPGTILGIYTSEKNYAKMMVLPSDSWRILKLKWQLYPVSESDTTQKTTPEKPDLAGFRQYEGLWAYSPRITSGANQKELLLGKVDGRGNLTFDCIWDGYLFQPHFTEAKVAKDQIEICFKVIEQGKDGTKEIALRYSLLFHNNQLLGQLFRGDTTEPQKVVLYHLGQDQYAHALDYLSRSMWQAKLRLREFAGKYEQLKYDNGKMKRDLEKKTAAQTMSKKLIDTLSKENDTRKERIEELVAEVTKVKKDNLQLSDKLTKLETERQQSLAIAAKLSENLAQSKNENARMQKQLDDLQTKLEQKEAGEHSDSCKQDKDS